MAAVEVKDRKKELVEKTAEQFQQLNEDNKMFILGLYAGYSAGKTENDTAVTDGIGGGTHEE